jgi:DNA-binding NarL/FixJ family response regulator
MRNVKTCLIEDSPVIAENLIATLSELASVEVVATVARESEAIAWLTAPAHEWQLAIVDVFLAEGSGLNVLAANRQRDTSRQMVVLSNYATPDVRRRCAELGANAVFDKSTELDALVEYCQQLAAE